MLFWLRESAELMKHEAEATLVRSAPYCGPPLLQAAVSCPCLRLHSPLRTLHLRHRQVLPSSQHFKGIAEKIHRILIILSSCTIASQFLSSQIMQCFLFMVHWLSNCLYGAPWPAGHYPLLWIPETSPISWDVTTTKMDRMTRNYFLAFWSFKGQR